MSKPIDWLYRRKSCVTCQRADSHLAAAGAAIRESVDATKVRYAPADALKLLDGVSTLVVVKGKQVETFDLAGDRPADDELLARIIGPTGNLRAPTARVGATMVVGYDGGAYRDVVGA